MFMNNDQMMKRVTRPNSSLTPGEVKRCFQLMLERIDALEKQLESVRGPGTSESPKGKDSSSGTRGRGRPRKSDAEGSDEEGSA